MLTGLPSRLLAFSDDMDGLRKVPDNVPNRDMLARYLGQPLTRIPDPFGTHASFGAHNNARLRAFLDSFGFEYEFASATDYYTSGRFDAALLRVLDLLRRGDGGDPAHPGSGAPRHLFAHPADPPAHRAGHAGADGTARPGRRHRGLARSRNRRGVRDAGDRRGRKLQWKADWAMRWFALGVDYEMSGKDLIDCVRLSGRICRILGAAPPEGLHLRTVP